MFYISVAHERSLLSGRKRNTVQYLPLGLQVVLSSRVSLAIVLTTLL
jgi:hypothetical protein